MFKYIKKGDQILALQAELRALKSNVGKAPVQDYDNEETPHVTLFEDTEKTKADVDYLYIMTGIEL